MDCPSPLGSQLWPKNLITCVSFHIFVLFIVDDECGNGHVMRCGAIRDDLAAMGVASEVWTGEAEEILRAQVIVVDDYGLGWPLIAQEWGDIGIIVIDDFAPGRRTWPAGTVVIAPVGEYAIVRQAIRRLKGTPKNISHLRVERGSIEAMSGSDCSVASRAAWLPAGASHALRRWSPSKPPISTASSNSAWTCPTSSGRTTGS